MTQQQVQFDYVIAGSGCAGLSLLYRILKDPVLSTKHILVIDKNEKNTNDRTWCFWEKGNGVFDPVVSHQWKTLEFLTTDFKQQYDLKQYRYKMIKGIDFYDYVLTLAKNFENVTFKKENIQKIRTEGDCAYVETENTQYIAEYVFNSTGLFHPEMNPENSLLQHFEGWVIKTDKPIFNEEIGTLMDFRLTQKHGITFMYILPTSAHEALIEYTLFSEKLLDKEAYKTALENYINDYLKLEQYEILHKEFGVIPMSLKKFLRTPDANQRIVNIGTAGGFTKASSGYTFQFIQRNAELIVDNLRKGKAPNPKTTFRESMFQWYDRTMLEVILSGKMEGKEIFSTLFQKCSIQTILAFLGNESSLLDDIKIMKSLPTKPFIKAGLKQLL
ncbi:MAG: lycopene cyclase family protein [Lutimonas sp.]